MRPATLAPIEVLGSRKPHGTRLRYMAGCKCVPCRAANSRYETLRLRRRAQGLWNGLVSAERAQNHMLWLSRQGVGRRTVSLHTGIADSVLFKIRSGERRQIRALTEKAILSIDKWARRGSTLVPAGETWKLIRWMLGEGFTKTRIARELGKKTGALQLNKRFVTSRNARRVRELVASYRLEAATRHRVSAGRLAHCLEHEAPFETQKQLRDRERRAREQANPGFDFGKGS